MWYLIYFVYASMNQPIILETFPTQVDCQNAQNFFRNVENEKAPFSHFCVDQASYERYAKEREMQDNTINRLNSRGPVVPESSQ